MSAEKPEVARNANPRGGKPSASGMARLCRCPGSWRLEQMCPEPNESEAAVEGTLLHAHMEHCTLPEDAEQVEVVEWCRSMEEQLVRRVLGEQPGPIEVEREVRLWDPQGQYSGQADVIYRAGEVALVLDYKFGRGAVECLTSNHQLGALAVLVRAHRGVRTVYAAILQPRVSRDKPTLVRYDEAALNSMERYLAARLAAAAYPDAALNPGEVQCKYCRAAAICPAQMQLAQQITAGRVLAGWEAWTPSQKRLAYDTAVLAKKWAEGVVGKCEADLRNGTPIDGLEMGAGRTSFTITDAQEAFSILHRELDVTAAEFVACCKVGITELHKLTHAKLKEREQSSNTKDSRRITLDLLAAAGEEKTTKGSIKSSAKEEVYETV